MTLKCVFQALFCHCIVWCIYISHSVIVIFIAHWMRPDGWWRIGRQAQVQSDFFLHSNCGNSGLRQEKGETSSTANATWNDAGTEWIPELRWCDGWELSWGDGAQPRGLACARRPSVRGRRPFRKFCRQRAGAPELKECYVNGKMTKA